MSKEKSYRAFLLRCWKEKESTLDGSDSWRFTAEEVGGKGSQKGFSSLTDLFDFLKKRMKE